jgi:phosphate transport system permease protein
LWLLRGTAVLSAGLLLLIIVFVVREAAPALATAGFTGFFNDGEWYPSEGQFNLVPMVTGTLWSSLGAVMLATPLGILSAVFCRFYAPLPAGRLYHRAIEILAGIPSVVYGFWGLMVLVPAINQWHAPGASLLAGVLVLTLMILPTIALTANAAIRALPQQYLLNSTALGLSRWSTVWNVVLPVVRGGIVSGVVLGLGRALGETMAVLMVTGNVVNNAGSVFEPIRTLTANIALEMAYALGTHRAALFVSGSLLMVMIIILMILAGKLEKRHVPAA